MGYTMQQQMFRLPYDQNLLQCPPRPALVNIDRRWKSSSMVEPAPRCPRCDSSNTKFCYYNNYSLTQPRYFCKGCRRYWTKGGSLRNIPVGGGCRKNRRTKSSRLSSSPGTAGQNYGRGSSVKSDGTAESSTRSGSSTDAAATSDGSTIDLAAVYAKFLNQQPSDHESGQMAAVTQLSDQFGPESCYGFPPCPSADFGLVDSPGAVVGNADTSGVQLDHRNILPSPPISSFKPDTTDYAVGQPAVGLGADSFWTNCDQVEPDFNWQSALESTLEDHLNLQPSFLNCGWSTSSFDLSQL